MYVEFAPRGPCLNQPSLLQLPLTGHGDSGLKCKLLGHQLDDRLV